MDSINKKLTLITDIWNSFIIEQEYIQNSLDFSEEELNNYYGEIMHYLKDTFPIIENYKDMKKRKGKFHEIIFYMTGLLQTLYTHQDLIDELLRIFSLKESGSKDKKIIRDLRNELVGHPISRNPKTNKLESSIFWIKGTYSHITYRKYIGGDWYSAKKNIIDISDLLSKHKNYLNEHFNKVIIKERKIISKYKDKLFDIYNLLTKDDLNIDAIVNLASNYISGIDNQSFILSSDYFYQALNRRTEKFRYQYYVDYYLYSIYKMVFSKINQINEYELRISKVLNNTYENKTNKEIKNKEPIFLDKHSFDDEGICYRDTYHYYLSKLYEKKFVRSIDGLIEENSSHTNLVYHLNNMKKAYSNNNDFEYYCSYIIVEKYLRREDIIDHPIT